MISVVDYDVGDDEERENAFFFYKLVKKCVSFLKYDYTFGFHKIVFVLFSRCPL